MQTPFPENFPLVLFVSNAWCARAHGSFVSRLSWQRHAGHQCEMAALDTVPRSKALLPPHAPTPSAFIHIGAWKKVTKKVAAELNLYAALSKNVRFLKNTPQEAEIHQGVADGCRRPTAPTTLQHQHHHLGTRGGPGCRRVLTHLSCFAPGSKEAGAKALGEQPLPGGSSPLPGGSSPQLPGETSQPSPFQPALSQDPKNTSRLVPPLCALISRPQRRADPGPLERCASQTAGLPGLVATCSPIISVMC